MPVSSVSDSNSAFAEWAARAKVHAETYASMYQASIADPDGFWAEHGKRVDWITPFTQVKDTSYDQKDFHIRWFANGALNVAAKRSRKKLR